MSGQEIIIIMQEENPLAGQTRSEEIQHIIDKMPTKFGFWLGLLVFLIFLLILIFGFVIQYPDVTQGNITISSGSSPIKLVSNTAGKIRILIKHSQINVEENQILGYIENGANPIHVSLIDSLIRNCDLQDKRAADLLKKLPTHLSLGELNSKYYQFSSSLQNYLNYKQDQLYVKQEESLQKIYKDQNAAISSATLRVKNAKFSLIYSHKFYSRDSALFKKKVISESELDHTEMEYTAAKDALQYAYSMLISARQSAEQTQSRISDLIIQIPEKQRDLKLLVISSYNDLLDNIKIWEQKYIFKAPFNGKAQLLNFYAEKQFVQNGEEVFSVVPKQALSTGKVLLPAKGAGKVKVGQEVIVKLEDFPFLEYGAVLGKVTAISLTSTNLKTEKSNVSAYLIDVSFPTGMVTNYKSTLDLKADSKGTAEIITNNRKLVERLFDNMRYRLIDKN